MQEKITTAAIAVRRKPERIFVSCMFNPAAANTGAKKNTR
jgi:hypothetical protein